MGDLFALMTAQTTLRLMVTTGAVQPKYFCAF
ncbi:hypothetical protein NIES4071_14630 [Calothrix sp. NIES-4071]|nr:hypothetical protein NIES4071_14630 [Calothrix sp. NIES-4071]BAZ55800.1 hypothetical protein NIES4105_14580 [Calothrix sp. NIES-4105]